MRKRSSQASQEHLRDQRDQTRKATGSHYTPRSLANFVAQQIRLRLPTTALGRCITLLDPAVGDGELLDALVGHLLKEGFENLCVVGYETNSQALHLARTRLEHTFPQVSIDLRCDDFLRIALEAGITPSQDLFRQSHIDQVDVVIANPPYVRTQVMGGTYARQLARQFELSGRVDLYHAFLKGIACLLRPGSHCGDHLSSRAK